MWQRIANRLVDLPRYRKRAILALIDFILVGAALWFLLSVRHQRLFVPDHPSQFALIILAPTLVVALFFSFGLYKFVTRFLDFRGLTQVGMTVGLAVAIWATIVFLSGQWGIPRSTIMPLALLGTGLIVLSRFVAGRILKSAGIKLPVAARPAETKPVIIYGAGEVGIGLLKSLRRTLDRDVIAFIDPTGSMRGQYVGSIKIHPPQNLQRLIERNRVREVLIAVPHVQRRELRSIIANLEKQQVDVLILPDFDDMTAGRVEVSDLRSVDIADLLGREAVMPIPEFMEGSIRSRAILVTGAGGSIGSEISRLILKHEPSCLVLLDQSELALYKLEDELSATIANAPHTPIPTQVYCVLGSVLDQNLLLTTLREHAIQTVYHAAAYKHVPIVEANPIAGIQNNVFGLKIAAECAEQAGVERFVLISTDKAVRPTNVMGASKRLSELILQDMARNGARTIFSMVRFGNVLGSSGSVVERFRKQIAAGGPVTVTHKDIVRYFMSIPEAASLVIQAGAMGKGGDVFLLEMGDPVRIDDLARLMIRLSGLEVRDAENLGGDIEIVYTGLRPGEKLYEELLIGADAIRTEHPQIFRSNEPCPPHDIIVRELAYLTAAIDRRDTAGGKAVLERLVEDYNPKSAMIESVA